MEQRQRQIDHVHCSGSRRSSPTHNPTAPLHRIAEVMEQEGVSPRGLAGRLGMTRANVVKASDPTHDMLLSDLYRWQAALRVPAIELLAESEDTFSSPILLRARLLKLMRTVRSIQEHSTEDPIQTLAMNLVEKLMEIMPELKDVSAWPVAGQQRKSHELGAIVYNVVPVQVFNVAPTET